MAARSGPNSSRRWARMALGPAAAAAWVITSFADISAGLVPGSVLVTATYLFLVLLPRLREPSIGTTLVIGAATLAPIMFLGGQALGMCFGLIALTLLVHARRHLDALWMWLAYVLVSAQQMLTSMSVQTAAGRWSLLVTIAVLQLPALLAWGLGLLLRKLDRRSAERVAMGFQTRQRSMSRDIHDLVSRPLTATTMTMRAATDEDWADPRFQQRILGQLEDADSALREIAAGRRGRGRDEGRALSERALRDGEATLTTLGFLVEREAQVDSAFRDLPPKVDTVVAQALAESLHNVAKHGDSTQPVRFVAARSSGRLAVGIANRCADQSRGHSSGMGLQHVRARVESLHGTASAELVDDVWLQRFTLPLPEEQTT